jgi:hypothetical protein
MSGSICREGIHGSSCWTTCLEAEKGECFPGRRVWRVLRLRLAHEAAPNSAQDDRSEGGAHEAAPNFAQDDKFKGGAQRTAPNSVQDAGDAGAAGRMQGPFPRLRSGAEWESVLASCRGSPISKARCVNPAGVPMLGRASREASLPGGKKADPCGMTNRIGLLSCRDLLFVASKKEVSGGRGRRGCRPWG